MTDMPIINVEGVSKKHCRSLRRSMLYGIKDIGREILGISPGPAELRQEEFWAVDDVSFSLNSGDCFGIIGPNGSGKSTLLKLISGIFPPDKGVIRVSGRVGSLIEVGAGFHPMLSGRENIYINGSILGLRLEEIESKLVKIIEFSGLDEFIDTPVKYYSSGMFIRLGVSVALHAQPDILIVDEALAVGDAAFQAKCMSAFHRFRDEGMTILFVSHDINAVKALCDRAIYLDRGQICHVGATAKVADYYLRQVRIDSAADAPINLPRHDVALDRREEYFVDHEFAERVSSFRQGSGEAQITCVEMLNEAGIAIGETHFNQQVIIRIHIRFQTDCEFVTSYYIRDDKHYILLGTSTALENGDLITGKSGDRKFVEFRTELPLAAGSYNLLTILSIPIVVNQSAKNLDYVENALVFHMTERQPIKLWSKVYHSNSVAVVDNE